MLKSILTALLWVPFEDEMENFVVRFDPQTGLIDTMEAMRYREAGEQAKKILWITKNIPGKTIAQIAMAPLKKMKENVSGVETGTIPTRI